MTISIIMSIYCLERPSYLDAALNSIWTEQIRKPDQIILVKDGPLNQRLDEIINNWKEKLGDDILIIVNNEANKGLADSLNEAIDMASGELIARMDTDDISLPERLLKQEQYMESHPEVDILGGSIREFNDEGTLNAVRTYPCGMKKVKKSIHKISPLAHPTVIFRRRFFDDGFKYDKKYYRCEDISLWFRAVAANRTINNLQDVILNFRRSDSTLERRKEIILNEFLAYNEGIYNLYGFFTTKYVFSFMRVIFRMLPIRISSIIYKAGGMRSRIAK